MGKKKTTTKKKPAGKYRYAVRMKNKKPYQSTERTMKGGSFTSKKKAESFYKKRKTATRIQRTERKSGHSAGNYNPDAPTTIKRGGKTFKKAYQGPHTATSAKKMQREFKARGVKTATKKTKHGTFLYYR